LRNLTRLEIDNGKDFSIARGKSFAFVNGSEIASERVFVFSRYVFTPPDNRDSHGRECSTLRPQSYQSNKSPLPLAVVDAKTSKININKTDYRDGEQAHQRE
jgi:hypothetical protein